MSALLELAERVEAAKAEQQYELLAEAWTAIFLGGDPNVPEEKRHDWRCFQSLLTIGAFLDAAMSLVLPRWHPAVGEVRSGPTTDNMAFRGVWTASLTYQREHETDTYLLYELVQASASSAALALTAAALRALATSQEYGK